MSLSLTLLIQDSDDPRKHRSRTVECSDLWAAMYEIEHVAGPSFVQELAALSWDALTRARDDPPDAGVAAVVR